jgi:agmatine deiminase
MPAEWEPHERTLMGWPTAVRVDALWHEQLDVAREVHALVARSVARYEPVTVVANHEEADDARRRCGDDVDVVELPIDDSWLRDSGPISVRDPHGERHMLHFGFNAWGEAFTPHDQDAKLGDRISRHLGIHCHDVTDFVLEGGSIVVDGAGCLVTTERCLLNPNRNPTLTRDEIETRLREWLGVEGVVWLRDGIAEDEGTDGHVDNVAAFVAPRHVVLQGCAVVDNPNHGTAAESVRRLEGAGIAVTEIAELPYATVAGREVPVPYGNFYLCNGAVIVPTVDGGDTLWLDAIGECAGDRDVVPVPGEVLAYGGGGVHCITQQVIA